MKITIGKFDPETGAVPVSFVSGAIEHKRSVNAVRKPDGSYDREATRTRVDEVAAGVAHKIALGVIA